MIIEKTKRYKTKVKRTRVQGKFKLNTRAIQQMVEEDLGDRNPPRREDGTVSLDGSWLKENTPSDHDVLQTLIQHDKLKKILNTYLKVYSQTGMVYPRITTLGPRSGRRSASRPNIQNVPKRKWGIRGLFVPRPGHYFVVCDYTAQELFTLAQTMIDIGVGKGPLWECVTSDLDPHILGATKTLGKPYETITKAERQGQKVVAFGVPGGLGPQSLKDYAFSTFGVRWTISEARRARDRFLRAFWDVDAYLKSFKRGQDEVLRHHSGEGYFGWKNFLGCGWNVIGALCNHEEDDMRELGEKCARHVPGRLRTGLVRSGARFTEVANTCFQGLAAAVTKQAEWELFKILRRPATIVCHDEMVVEFPLVYDVDQAKRVVKCSMLTAFQKICPDVGPYAKAEAEGPAYKWGKDTDMEGNEI